MYVLLSLIFNEAKVKTSFEQNSVKYIIECGFALFVRSLDSNILINSQRKETNYKMFSAFIYVTSTPFGILPFLSCLLLHLLP